MISGEKRAACSARSRQLFPAASAQTVRCSWQEMTSSVCRPMLPVEPRIATRLAFTRREVLSLVLTGRHHLSPSGRRCNQTPPQVRAIPLPRAGLRPTTAGELWKADSRQKADPDERTRCAQRRSRERNCRIHWAQVGSGGIINVAPVRFRAPGRPNMEQERISLTRLFLPRPPRPSSHREAFLAPASGGKATVAYRSRASARSPGA